MPDREFQHLLKGGRYQDGEIEDGCYEHSFDTGWCQGQHRRHARVRDYQQDQRPVCQEWYLVWRTDSSANPTAGQKKPDPQDRASELHEIKNTDQSKYTGGFI